MSPLAALVRLKALVAVWALCAVLALGARPAQAFHQPPEPEVTDQVTIELDLPPSSTDWASVGLSPGMLINQRDIDLLLDMQLNTVNLGPTPTEPASSLPQQAAVDVRSLSPDVPANPVFPGHGLSFVPSSQAQRPMATLQQRQGDDEEVDNRPKRMADTVAGWLGLDPHQSQAITDLRSLRQWLLEQRAPLLGGAGLLMLLALGVAALSQRRGASAPQHESMRLPPRRRRRRGTHRSA